MALMIHLGVLSGLVYVTSEYLKYQVGIDLFIWTATIGYHPRKPT